MSKELLNVTVEGGKYTVIQHEDGSATALRYGEEWPAFKNVGPDNLHMALAREVASLRKQLADQKTINGGTLLTAAQLADALDCYWNAALDDAMTRQSQGAMDAASVTARGIAAVANRLREIDQ